MAAPTLSSSVHDPYTDTGTLTATVTWSAGDLLLVLAAGESEAQVVNTPTATGLTFIPIASRVVLDDCFVGAWYAEAAGSGSGVTITATVSGVQSKGMSVFVYSGHGGLGNWAIAPGGVSATTLSLNRGQDNSAVVWILADFGANTDVTVTSSPASGATQHVAINDPGSYTVFVFSWTDQSTAGNTSYGFSAGASVDNSMIAIEIRGSNPSTIPSDRFMPFRAA